ncbi:unnamed protein product [Meganyctiphanes norvegica]|uniref:Tumor protein p53-inducible nuclear protein 1 n=1 Tax=Meganyctiphanes norvegica TaxID=48144 RepID=A0AAV2QQM5_MEGNR
MLANITSYFWGNESEETPCVEENEEKCEKVCDNVPVTTVTAKPSETATLKTTTPQEDDWVMVHRSEVFTEGGLATTTSTSPACSEVPYTATQGTTNTMEGGAQDWLVTPPSVFTESQICPIASSPIENLLIEHPSMSVYLPRPTSCSNMSARGHVMSHSIPCSPPSANCKSPVLEEKQEETEQQENNQTPQQMEEAANRTAGVTSRAANLLQAIDVLRPQQKAQRRREERRLKHKHLIYGNKVREVASAGNGRSRRCHMMTPEKFSRAVNNRKC